MAMTSPKDSKTKAIGMAVGASIIAAVAAMLVPTAILESITGATGLSELVPATAAPLGDKARALIAFTAGAVTMVLVLAFLLRRADGEIKSDGAIQQKGGFGMIALLKQRMGKFSLPKMAWNRDENSGDVFELSDLPKLRKQDAHPDTPVRRPLSATSDLGAVELYDQCAPLPSVAAISELPVHFADNITENDTEFVLTEQDFETAQPAYQPFVSAPAADIAQEDMPSLADLVAQFENAVQNRKAMLAGRLAQESDAAESALDAPRDLAPAALPAAPPARPPLEAVPAIGAHEADDDMDAALNAALATLKRMNAQ